MGLEGKVALVTGASGGIGAAVARSLHDAGASVGLLSRRGDDLGLMTADEVADVVLFTVTRPRRMRILTTSFRPMTEPAWG